MKTTTLLEHMYRHFIGKVRMPNLRKQLTGRPAQNLLFEPGNEQLLTEFVKLHQLDKQYQEKLFAPKFRKQLELYIRRWPLCNALQIRLFFLKDLSLAFIYVSHYPIPEEAQRKIIKLRNPKLLQTCKYSFDLPNEMILTLTKNVSLIMAYLKRHSLCDAAQVKLIEINNPQITAFYNDRYCWCNEALDKAQALEIDVNADFVSAAS